MVLSALHVRLKILILSVYTGITAGSIMKIRSEISLDLAEEIRRAIQ